METYVTRIGDVTIERVLPKEKPEESKPPEDLKPDRVETSPPETQKHDGGKAEDSESGGESSLDEEEELPEEESEEEEEAFEFDPERNEGGDNSAEMKESKREDEEEEEEEEIAAPVSLMESEDLLRDIKNEPDEEGPSEGTPNEQNPGESEEPSGEHIVVKEEPADADDESEDSFKRKAGESDEDSVDSKTNKKKKMGEEGESEGEKGATERKACNLRRNIREVMDETQLDEATLSAQRQEMERLRRVQDQQKYIREVQRQIAINRQNNKTQTRVMSLLQGNNNVLKSAPGSSKPSTVLVKLSSNGGPPQVINKKMLEALKGGKTPPAAPEIKSGICRIPNKPHMVTPSVSIAPVKPSTPIEPPKPKGKDVVTISSSSDEDDCIVISEPSDEEIEEEEDPNNSGMHTNDLYNIPDEQGRVLINVGKPENDPDVFLAPQIARIIKPHQIGGVRFMFDNVVESLERFNTSPGFGCILAHSMGLGKTLQVVSFCDVFLRETPGRTVMCIMPINTLQNWMAEFNMWLPTDLAASPLSLNGEVRSRNFGLFVLNDLHKTIAARARVVQEWKREGGVLLIGYEMYRQLSLKRPARTRKGKKKVPEEDVDDEKNKPLLEEMHESLVKPGPDLVICDEGHRIKNSHASISHALKQIRTRRRIVLTGYPLQNNLQEYWCMVDFVRPNYLGSKTEFSNMFERPIQNGQCIDSTPQDIRLMRYRAHVLHSLLEGFVQRRSHAVLRNTLPQKEEYVLLVRMTSFQRKLYDTFMNEVVRTKAVPNPLKAFAVCCKIWNHPDILYNFLKKREMDELQDLDLEEAAALAPGTHPQPEGASTPGRKPRDRKGKGSAKKAQAVATPIKTPAVAAVQPNTSQSSVDVKSEIGSQESQGQFGGSNYNQNYPYQQFNNNNYPHNFNGQNQEFGNNYNQNYGGGNYYNQYPGYYPDGSYNWNQQYNFGNYNYPGYGGEGGNFFNQEGNDYNRPQVKSEGWPNQNWGSNAQGNFGPSGSGAGKLGGNQTEEKYSSQPGFSSQKSPKDGFSQSHEGFSAQGSQTSPPNKGGAAGGSNFQTDNKPFPSKQPENQQKNFGGIFPSNKGGFNQNFPLKQQNFMPIQPKCSSSDSTSSQERQGQFGERNQCNDNSQSSKEQNLPINSGHYSDVHVNQQENAQMPFGCNSNIEGLNKPGHQQTFTHGFTSGQVSYNYDSNKPTNPAPFPQNSGNDRQNRGHSQQGNPGASGSYFGNQGPEQSSQSDAFGSQNREFPTGTGDGGQYSGAGNAQSGQFTNQGISNQFPNVPSGSFANNDISPGKRNNDGDRSNIQNFTPFGSGPQQENQFGNQSQFSGAQFNKPSQNQSGGSGGSQFFRPQSSCSSEFGSKDLGKGNQFPNTQSKSSFGQQSGNQQTQSRNDFANDNQFNSESRMNQFMSPNLPQAESNSRSYQFSSNNHPVNQFNNSTKQIPSMGGQFGGSNNPGTGQYGGSSSQGSGGASGSNSQTFGTQNNQNSGQFAGQNLETQASSGQFGNQNTPGSNQIQNSQNSGQFQNVSGGQNNSGNGQFANQSTQGNNVFQNFPGSSQNQFGNQPVQGNGKFGNHIAQSGGPFGPQNSQVSGQFEAQNPQGSGQFGTQNTQGSGQFGSQNPQGSGQFGSQNSQGGGQFAPQNPQGGGQFGPQNSQGGGQFAPQNPQGGGQFAPQNPQGSGQFGPQNSQGGGQFGAQNSQGGGQFGPQNPQGGGQFGPQNSQGGGQFAPPNSQGGGQFAPQNPQGSGQFGPQNSQGGGQFGAQNPQGSGQFSQNSQGNGQFGQSNPQGNGQFNQNPQGSGQFGPSPSGNGQLGQNSQGNGQFGQNLQGSGLQNPQGGGQLGSQNIQGNGQFGNQSIQNQGNSQFGGNQFGNQNTQVFGSQNPQNQGNGPFSDQSTQGNQQLGGSSGSNNGQYGAPSLGSGQFGSQSQSSVQYGSNQQVKLDDKGTNNFFSNQQLPRSSSSSTFGNQHFQMNQQNMPGHFGSQNPNNPNMPAQFNKSNPGNPGSSSNQFIPGGQFSNQEGPSRDFSSGLQQNPQSAPQNEFGNQFNMPGGGRFGKQNVSSSVQQNVQQGNAFGNQTQQSSQFENQNQKSTGSQCSVPGNQFKNVPESFNSQFGNQNMQANVHINQFGNQNVPSNTTMPFSNQNPNRNGGNQFSNNSQNISGQQSTSGNYPQTRDQNLSNQTSPTSQPSGSGGFFYGNQNANSLMNNQFGGHMSQQNMQTNQNFPPGQQPGSKNQFPCSSSDMGMPQFNNQNMTCNQSGNQENGNGQFPSAKGNQFGQSMFENQNFSQFGKIPMPNQLRNMGMNCGEFEGDPKMEMKQGASCQTDPIQGFDPTGKGGKDHPEKMIIEDEPFKHPDSVDKVGEMSKEMEAKKDDKEETKRPDITIAKSSKDDPGIPYDWATELLKGYVPGKIEASGKMAVFFCILEESIALEDRILVFSQSLFTLNLMEELLQQQFVPGKEEKWIRNVNYYRLDGSTTALEREKLINEFNSNPNLHLFLVSTRAGSLGINLVGANRVIVFDASWNPCHDTQAVCRVYRYGQKKPCFVYRLVTDNCLEKKIYDRQINKQGMADRVVDECNPEAHLSIKEVTSLCWDDQEDNAPKDFTDIQDKYIDVVIQKVLQKHSELLSKEPFHHESLLVDRKDKKLSQAEKRLAKRSYELEKQANSTNSRPMYNHYPNAPGNQQGVQIRGMRQDKPMASVRPMQSELGSQMVRDGRQRGWIPASVWQRQGMSAQEMTLPLDVVIPTNSPDRASIVLKAGQKVMVLKSPKGIYMQLENGKIIAIRTAFKVGGKDKKPGDKPEPKKEVNIGPRPARPPIPNLRNSSISIIPRTVPATIRAPNPKPVRLLGPKPEGKGKQPMAAARPYIREPPVTVTVTKKRIPEPSTSEPSFSMRPLRANSDSSDEDSDTTSEIRPASLQPVMPEPPFGEIPPSFPRSELSIQRVTPNKQPVEETSKSEVGTSTETRMEPDVPYKKPEVSVGPSRSEVSRSSFDDSKKDKSNETSEGEERSSPGSEGGKHDATSRQESFPPSSLPNLGHAVSIFPVGKPPSQFDYPFPRSDYYPSFPSYPRDLPLQYPSVYGEGYAQTPNPFSAAAAASRVGGFESDYNRYSAFHRPDPVQPTPPPPAPAPPSNYTPYSPYNPFIMTPPQFLPANPPPSNPQQ